MTADQWQLVKGLLEEVLHQTPANRVEWLEANCPDTAVRREVLSLLEAHVDLEDFLEKPTDAGPQLADALGRDARLGDRIGAWRLIEEIGQGGMGTVYRAIRADDEFRREAAVKIVSRGMDTDLLLRKFRTERQILANLEHPYIARLLDGGTTSGGLPYFVMEYVPGVPITEYCDRERLDITARLQLFRKVCSAVAYAHSNLIVHRDLKPANILVTADGTPKLLDFGIARMMSTSGSSEPTVTMLRMATPAYASPEQIRGRAAGIPSDIYSLGVLLYELLTGHRPYRLPMGDSGELARVICEREPTRPSLVVSMTESVEASDGNDRIVEAEEVCYDRDTTLDQLRRKLRGDLDNIISMALRKETHRRYESVEQFSEDLQRHLSGLPILARKDTFGYRTAKFLDRNRWGVVAAAVVAVVLMVISAVAIHKAARLAHRVEEDHRLASSFVAEIYDHIARLPGSTPAREAILNQSLRYLNGLSAEAGGDDPGFRRSLALAYERFAELQIGSTGSGLGRSADALTTAKQGLAIREALAAASPRDSLARFELAKNYLLTGYICGRATNAEDRRFYDGKALAIMQGLTQRDPRNPEYRLVLARAHSSLGYGLLYEDKFDEVRAHLREALAIYSEIAAEDPSNIPAQRELAQIHYRLGVVCVQSLQPNQARQELLQALAYQKRLSAGSPEDGPYRFDIASTHHFLGMAYNTLMRYPESIRQFDQAIAIRTAALEADEVDNRTRSMLAGNYAEKASALLGFGDRQAALASAQKAVDLQRKVLAADLRGVATRISLAGYLSRLGSVYSSLQASPEAAQAYRTAVQLYAELRSEGHLRSPAIQSDAEKARVALLKTEEASSQKNQL